MKDESDRKPLLLHPSERSFPPGSVWLYAKLYTGRATTDALLREGLGPLVRSLRERGVIEGWFFIRYGDPDWHVRLCFHGTPERLRGEALPAVESAVNPLLRSGLRP